MAAVSRDRDRARLEQELEADEYRRLLGCLQRSEPFLRQFTAWGEVIAFMRRGTSRDPRKDDVLRPILAAHAADQDHRWRTILFAVFWPGLVSLHRRKGHWDKDDPDELWQRIFWAFHESVCRINLDRRSDRLAQWICNSTFHRLYRGYERDWTRATREPSTDPEDINTLAGDIDGIDFEGMELREEHRRAIHRLHEHFKAGRITEADYLLLVGTRLYGQTLAEHARGAGLNEEAAKKRRQRAEASIRLHDKGLR
jgi:hypothetical protein